MCTLYVRDYFLENQISREEVIEVIESVWLFLPAINHLIIQTKILTSIKRLSLFRHIQKISSRFELFWCSCLILTKIVIRHWMHRSGLNQSFESFKVRGFGNDQSASALRSRWNPDTRQLLAAWMRWAAACRCTAQQRRNRSGGETHVATLEY